MFWYIGDSLSVRTYVICERFLVFLIVCCFESVEVCWAGENAGDTHSKKSFALLWGVGSAGFVATDVICIFQEHYWLGCIWQAEMAAGMHCQTCCSFCWSQWTLREKFFMDVSSCTLKSPVMIREDPASFLMTYVLVLCSRYMYILRICFNL